MTRKSKSPASKRRRSHSAAKRKTATSSRSPESRGIAVVIAVVRMLVIGVAAVCLAVFCYVAARLTFTPVHDHGQAVGNTRIGHSLRFYLDRPSIKEAIRQVGGNLALLAPLGILGPVVFPRLRSLPAIVIAGTLVSAVVEIAQGTLVPGRAFDIDDVLLNVIGVALAYLLAGRKIAAVVRSRTSIRPHRP